MHWNSFFWWIYLQVIEYTGLVACAVLRGTALPTPGAIYLPTLGRQLACGG